MRMNVISATKNNTGMRNRMRRRMKAVKASYES
jgi:hypothetical protein